jgi:hypothetical protein
MSNFPKLSPDEVLALAEYSGKLIDSGWDPEAADTEAKKRILEERKRREALRKPHFIRIITTCILPIVWVIKRLVEQGTLLLVFGDSGAGGLAHSLVDLHARRCQDYAANQ